MTRMTTVSKHSLVYITYSLLDARGAVVELHDQPVGYVQGANSGILPVIESAVMGHAIGDQIEIALSAEEVFGLRDENLIFIDDIKNVPPEYRRVGAKVMFDNASGETKAFYVTAIKNGQVTLDGNPALSGESVTCLLNVIDIRNATPDEIRHGRPLEVKTGTVH
jgi:FKBP-type peptidyl-prolyl cis-trans isomerase SlyD